MGADDYITKPFSVREFQARVKAILRRSKLDAEHSNPNIIPELRFKKLIINQDLRKVENNSQRLNLTPKEFELLSLMANNPRNNFV